MASPDGLNMWRPAVSLDEALRNLWSRRWATVAAVAVVAAMLFTIGAAEANEVNAVLLESRQRLAEGGNVYVVEPSDPEAGEVVDTGRCDQLARLPQIVASGGLSKGETIAFAEAPGNPFQTFGGSGGIIEVLSPRTSITPSDPSAPALWVGPEVASQLGLDDGSAVVVGDGDTVTLRFFDAGNRYPVGSTMVVDLDGRPRTDACWFEVEPGGDKDRAVAAAEIAYFGLDEPVRVRPLLEDDPPRPYGERTTRLLWVPGLLFVFMVGAFLARTSRSEMAIYKSLGFGPTGAALIAATEYVLTVSLALVLAGATIILILDNRVERVALANGLYMVAAAGLGVAAGLVLYLAMARGSTADQLKERF